MPAAREPLTPRTPPAWHTPPIARLLAAPQRFEFVQAVRLLLLWLGERGVPPDAALARHLRFPNSVSLAFPASEIEALRPAPGAAGPDAPPQFWLTPAFMGLLGVQGALPLHVTEGMLAWRAPQDEAPGDAHGNAARAFLDMFSTRMLALFYGAWRKHRVEEAVGGAADAWLPLLLSLAGLPDAGRDAERAGIAPAALARFAGVARRRPVSAAVLARVLADYFGVAVAVLEGVGHWDPLALHEQTRLGSAPPGWMPAHGLLGASAILGACSWRPDLRVRVRIGPLSRRQFERFLPHGPAARALRTLLGLLAVPTLSYEVVLVLRRDAIRPVRLDGDGRRLGVDSYLVAGPPAGDRADMRYEIRPLRALPPLPPPPPPSTSPPSPDAHESP